MAFHLDKHAVFHANQLGQLALAFVDVGVLDHHGGFPVAAVWHQRSVSLDLLQDALFFEDFFDAQHLLNLVADGGFAFKLHVDVLAQPNTAQLAVRNDVRLVQFAPLGVSLQGHQSLGRDFSSQLHGSVPYLRP